jgi:hypothetical protein
MLHEVCSHFNNKMYRLEPDVSSGFCGLNYVRRLSVMPKSKSIKKKSHSGKNRTPISGHTRVGKQLLPPFAEMEGKVAFSSWTNERMPEMLWAVIVRAIDGQDFAISQFRRIINFIGNHERKEEFSDLTHTGISKIDSTIRAELIACITKHPDIARGLTILRLFNDLPAAADWLVCIPEHAPDIELLMTAVGQNLSHQSQEATDCRWLRLMAQLAAGKLHVPREMAEEWIGYPGVGDQKAVRPSIRASEIALTSMDPPDTTWADSFWLKAWHNTPCLVLNNETIAKPAVVPVTRTAISDLVEKLEEHWQGTHSTTSVDARHDSVFGIAFYALRLIDELLGVGVRNGILGRLGLRTLLEAYVSIHYLLHKDDEALWKKWRAYGAGQAKLNALRFDTDMDPPKFINIEWIEQIAGEDIWEEFLNIALGSWSGLDLRKLSEQSGCKDQYDTHYSWTSGYVHGTWGPVREAAFTTCGNPLHRMHRYPDQKSLPDIVSDAVDLANRILDDLNSAYPDFLHRIPAQ